MKSEMFENFQDFLWFSRFFEIFNNTIFFILKKNIYMGKRRSMIFNIFYYFQDVCVRKTYYKVFFCERSEQTIDYGHFEQKILRARLLSMAFFVNILISEKIVFSNGFLKTWSWVFKKLIFILHGLPKLFKKKNELFEHFWQKKSTFENVSQYHLIHKICQCEHFGEQNI